MKRILIIEDNLEIAELERDFLEASAIESVIETDGTKGLERAPPDSLYTNLIMLAQILSTAAVGIHLLVGKYVGLDQKTWGYHNSPKLLATSVVFISAMSLWTNYFNELADLPNNMQEAFEMIMRNPLGIIAVVIMAPIVEELLFINGSPRMEKNTIASAIPPWQRAGRR